MHDPLVVAFEIRRPWPSRSRSHDSIPVPEGKRQRPRWYWSFPFATVAGKGLYFPGLITVWHREPGGHDSGTVCKHHTRVQDANGKWSFNFHHAWKFHVHHWHIQLHPWQHFRRWAFTRCEWCGGRSSKGDPVNISHQWHQNRGPWWRGERGLFHDDCSSVQRCHGMCLCGEPKLEHDTYGRCLGCGAFRAYGTDIDDAHRALAALPKGSRITPEVRAFVQPLWAERWTRCEEARRND